MTSGWRLKPGAELTIPRALRPQRGDAVEIAQARVSGCREWRGLYEARGSVALLEAHARAPPCRVVRQRSIGILRAVAEISARRPITWTNRNGSDDAPAAA